MISEYDEVKKILDQNDVTDLEQIEYGWQRFMKTCLNIT